VTNKIKNSIGLIVGIVWFVTVITFGWRFFDLLTDRYGDTFGAFSLLYLFGVLAVLFVGRASLEHVLTKVIKFESAAESLIGTSVVYTDSRVAQIGAVALCTFVGIGLSPIDIDNDNIVSESNTSANIEWIAE